MLADYFQAEILELSERSLAKTATLDQWEYQRKKGQQDLFEMLGLSPLPDRTDLKATVTGKVEQELFTVEKLHFQSRPGLYVTANLYLPKNVTDPAPTVLYLSGHGPVIKDGISYGNKVAYQHHGAWFARNGYVCLVLDTLQLGEIQGLHHGTYREGMWWWNSRGYTPAGVEAWNAIRALDYLSTRPEVDTNRFGVTGRSGGGAYSWWLAALDDRIKVAAPVAGITDLQNHVVDGTVEGHCDCMFMINTWRWDYPQVAALVAPRPLMIGNTDNDTIFPLDGVERLHSKVRKIYQLYKANTNLALLISEGPHKDTQDLQVPVFRWFNRHLKGDSSQIQTVATNFFQPEQLRVFTVLPTDQINANLHEKFVELPRPPPIPTSTNAWERERDRWVSLLNQKTFAAWSREHLPLELEQKFSAARNGLRLQAWDFNSQTNVRLRLYLLQRANLSKPEQIKLIVLGPAGGQSGPIEEETQSACPNWEQWVGALELDFGNELAEELQNARSSTNWLGNNATKQLASLKSVLQTNKYAFAFIAPRGIGLTSWNPDAKKQVHIRRRFMLLGQTVEEMRTWDIRRAIQALRSMKPLHNIPLSLQAQGLMAANAIYASLYEDNIARLDLWALPRSHMEGPDYLNVLRILDLPQTVAMAAERSSVRLHRASAVDWQFPASIANSLRWGEGRFAVE
jgi:dienelactone hydrolase